MITSFILIDIYACKYLPDRNIDVILCYTFVSIYGLSLCLIFILVINILAYAIYVCFTENIQENRFVNWFTARR